MKRFSGREPSGPVGSANCSSKSPDRHQNTPEPFPLCVLLFIFLSSRGDNSFPLTWRMSSTVHRLYAAIRPLAVCDGAHCWFFFLSPFISLWLSCCSAVIIFTVKQVSTSTTHTHILRLWEVALSPSGIYANQNIHLFISAKGKNKRQLCLSARNATALSEFLAPFFRFCSLTKKKKM